VIAKLTVVTAGQAPSSPSIVQVLAAVQPFAGTIVYVSTSGSDQNPGTQTSPVRTIQRGVSLANQANAAGQPAWIQIASGTYREAVDLGPQRTDAALIIEGAGSTTILTGADDWSTGWTSQSGGVLVHRWPHKWGMKPLPVGFDTYWRALGSEKEELRRSEMVYVNGAPLTGVLSLSALVAGSFYVDENAAQLYVKLPEGAIYGGATIEVGIRPTPLRVNARRNVTLRNFAVMRNRGAVQDTGFSVTNSRNITFDSIIVKWMAYSAWGGFGNTTIRIYRSVFSDNGVLAVSSYKDVDVIIEDSEVARNNWRGSVVGHVGWDSVFKWAGVHDGIVRRTQFIDNRGNGFWLDTDNQRITIENSLLSGQVLKGISLENNPGPITISDNRICNNTQAGVGDAQSNNVTLRNNQIFANTGWNILFTGTYSGQTSQDWQTGVTSTNQSLSWVVEGNVIAGSGTDGWLWWHTDHNAPGAWARIRNTMLLIDNNTWYHADRTTAFKLPQGSAAYAAFQGDLRLANPEWEAQGAWRDPGPLSCTMP
jgi:hypothetical protein